MQNSVDLLLAQYPRHKRTVTDASPHHRSPANRPFVPCAQVVNHSWDVARANECLAGMASDISSATGD
jgi:hypothetical protein